MRPEDRELYVLWSGPDVNAAVVTGRRNAWNAYRILQGGLIADEVTTASKHLESAVPTPVGEIVRRMMKHGRHVVVLYKATEWTPPVTLPGA